MREFATLKSTLRKTTGEGLILSRIDYFRTASEAGSAALKFAALVPALAPDALVVYSKARANVRIRGKSVLAFAGHGISRARRHRPAKPTHKGKPDI